MCAWQLPLGAALAMRGPGVRTGRPIQPRSRQPKIEIRANPGTLAGGMAFRKGGRRMNKFWIPWHAVLQGLNCQK